MSDTGGETLHDRFQGRWRWGWLYAAVWLVFLTGPLVDALNSANRVRGTAGALVIVTFSALYLITWSSVRRMRRGGLVASWRWRLIVLGSSTALTVAGVLLIGQSAMAMTTYLVVTVMFLLPIRPALIGTAVVIASTVVATEWVPGWSRDLSAALGLLLTAFVMWGIVQMVERNAQLARAHAQLAELAVSQERARFARDLHDLLGHSLTLLAIKAELAGRLVRIDPDRAEQEVAAVERLARDALVDVRSAVGGYRQATLAGELAAARAVLDAAGIESDLPAAVDQVPGERRELLGWAVREGVTNVVRHSRARSCRIVVDQDGVQVLDDGRGPVAADGGLATAVAGPGHGLTGLRERADAAGAYLMVGRSEQGGFALRVGWGKAPAGEVIGA